MASHDSTRIAAGRIFRKIRANSVRRGIDVSITLDHVDALMRAQDMRCAITGIPFDLSPKGKQRSRCRPFYPSVDRIDSDSGYSPGNIRVVCVAVNYALCDWGIEVLRRVAIGVCNQMGHIVTPVPLDAPRPPWINARSGKNGTPRYEVAIRPIPGGQLHYFGTFGRLPDAVDKANTVRAAIASNGDWQSLKPRPRPITIPAQCTFPYDSNRL